MGMVAARETRDCVYPSRDLRMWLQRRGRRQPRLGPIRSRALPAKLAMFVRTLIFALRVPAAQPWWQRLEI